MLNFFKKKPRTLREHLNYIVENPKLRFQLDFYRNNQVDFQLIRQSMLNSIDFKGIKDPSGLAFSITFNSEKDKNEQSHKNFINSTLFKKSKKINLGGDTFIILTGNNYEDMDNIIHTLQKEIYNVDYDKSSSFVFNKIGNNR
jgi:hypothetical protein